MYKAIDDNVVLDAMFVNCGGAGLHVTDAKRFCATQQELEICAGGELECTRFLGARSGGRLRKICLLGL